MKLGTRVLAYGLLLAWIPLILLSAFVTYTIVPRLEAAIAAKAAATAREKADAVNQLLLGANNHLQTIAMTSHERIFSMTPLARQALFYDLLKINPLLEEIYLLDPLGQSVDWASRWRVTTARQPEKVDIIKDSSGSFLTNVHREEDGRLTSILCVPIRSAGWQQPAGYLGGKIRLRAVADLTLTSSHYGEGAIFIVNQLGRLVGHEDFSQSLLGVDVRTSPAVHAFMAQASSWQGELKADPEIWVQRYTSYTGMDVLGSFVPVGNWGWAVVVEEQREEALRPVAEWMRRFHLIGIFLTLCVVGISYFFARKITEPIRALETGVNRIARGEWEQELSGEGSDEVGQLVTAFNRMLKEQREKKELEERLAMTEKLATLGTVATSVAHEINNPLAIISGYSEDLLDRLQEGDSTALTDDGKRYLSVISDQAKRCKTIIRAWLDLARLPVLTPQQVNVADAVHVVRELILFRAQKKGITLLPPVTTNHHTPLPDVVASAGELQQVLLNILMNAVDASSDGDTIAIQLSSTESHVIITIEDTGEGIDSAHLSRVGKSFFTTKPPGQGTGLGLYISRDLVERWGGTLQLHSAGPGKGTTAIIELPAACEGGTNGQTY